MKVKLPLAWRHALLAAMCATAGGFSAASAETIEYNSSASYPKDLVVDGAVKLICEWDGFVFNSIQLNNDSLELYLTNADNYGPSTLLQTDSLSGEQADVLRGGNEKTLALTLNSSGTAVNIGEQFKKSSFNLVQIGKTVQNYGFLDVTIGERTQHIAAGAWGETGSFDDMREMRQTWLFHFDGSAVSFEGSKRFADIVSESSTERLIRYYTADFGGGTKNKIEVTTVSNDAATGSLVTNKGTHIGVNCRAADGELHLDSAHPLEGFSNVQNAIDARVNKADGTMTWTAGRDVVTLWLQGDNTVEAVVAGQASSLEVGALEIRQGGSLTMNGTNLSGDSVILSGANGKGAALTALNAKIDAGVLQTTGSEGSVIAVGGGLTADVVDFQDASTSLILHVGEKAVSGAPLFSAGEVTAATGNLISASGGSAVSVTVDAGAASSLVNTSVALVSIGGAIQAYDAMTLNIAGNTTRQLADGQWEKLDVSARTNGDILLYQYRDGSLVFDSTLRTVENQTADSYDAVSRKTGEVNASAIGTGIAATAPLQATVTDTRAVTLDSDSGYIASVGDSVVRTDWVVGQPTSVNASTSAPGAIRVTSLAVDGSGTNLHIGNVSLTTTGDMHVGASTSVSMGGLPLQVGGALTLDGSLALTVGGATASSSTLVSTGSIAGTNAASLTGDSLGGGAVSLSLDTANQGANLLGKEVTLVSIGGAAQRYTSLTLTDGGTIADTSAKSPGLYDLKYKASDGADLYLAYSFDGTTLTFGNSLSYVAPPNESKTEDLPGGGSVTKETSVKTDLVRQDVENGSFAEVQVDLPNTQDPTQSGGSLQVATNITVSGNLHFEASTVSTIEKITTKDKDGNVTDTQVNISPAEATLTRLVVDENVALTQSAGGIPASVSVDKTEVFENQTLTLDNTVLESGLSLNVEQGGAIDARGEEAKIVIGGRGDLGGGLEEQTTSEIRGDIYLSEGATLTAERVGGADGKAPEINIVDTTIHLGVAKGDEPGDAKTEGNIDGANVGLRLSNVAIQGTGTVSHVQMNGGSLTAGHSPGQLTLSYLEGNGTHLQVSILGENVRSGQLNGDTTGADGAISQFVVGENVHVDNGTFSVFWDGTDAEHSKLTEGTSFQFFDFKGGSLTGNITVDENSLPELADRGLTWDFSQLMTTGIASIVGIRYADPSRVANTLVSAGDVVAGFGNMLYGHAREASARGSNFWVSGLGDFSDYASRGGRTGYTYNGAGYAVGYNWVNTCGHTLGVAFGQEFGKHEPKLGTSQFTPGRIDQDTVMFGLYGRCVAGRPTKRPIAVDAYAAYGRVDNHSRKTRIGTGENSSAKWNDDVFAAGLTASCEYRVCTATVLRPFVALEFVYASMDSFQEGDGNSFASYTDGTYSNFSGSAGLQVYRPYELRNGMVLTPSFSAAYVGDMVRNDGRVKATDAQGRALRGRSVSPGRNGFQGTAALDWRINSRWGMRAAYMIETRSGAVDQDVNLGVNYTF